MDKPYVLICDDEQRTADTIGKVVEISGKYTPIVVNSGKDALEKIKSHNTGLFKKDQNKIKLVLCDIRMPEMSGIETLEAISKLDPNVRIIMVTAFDEEEYWDDTVIGGAAIGYIVKPFKNDYLLKVIDDFFAGYESIIKSQTLEGFEIKTLRQAIDEDKEKASQLNKEQDKNFEQVLRGVEAQLEETEKNL